MSLKLVDFKPHYKGEPIQTAEPLDRSAISSIGILAYGGIHLPKKQQGTASLEIDWIKLE